MKLLHRISVSKAVSSVSVRAVLQSFSTDGQRTEENERETNVETREKGVRRHVYTCKYVYIRITGTD